MNDEELVDRLFQRLDKIESRLEKIESAEKEEPWHSTLGNWSQEAFNPPGQIDGIVVDEGKARESDCRCIPLGYDSRLCYSQGVVGALSRDQEQLYCSTITNVEASPALVERQRIMKDAALLCQAQVQSTPEGQRLEPFLKCMSKEAKRGGVEI